MKYPIPNPSGNQMLSLINGLYQRSAGMCSAGAGPYGIGTSVVEDALIGVSLKQQSGGMAQSHSSASSWLLVCLLRYSARSCLLAGRVACFPQSGHCSGSSGVSNR